ncbi:MAG TPA: hypothetical protein VLL54_03505 [Pyrinomonadaceae bacterium]|nr:hypothetical protein [Pyrinomonadaceae bacterium]
MKKSLLFVLLVILVPCSKVLAQPAEAGPPKVLYIVREDIKPGMMDSHGRHSANFAAIFRALETPNYRIALVPIAGSENEVLYITGTETFKALEDLLNATDQKMGAASGNTKAELERLGKEAPVLHAAMRDMLSVFRPELSFNPNVNIRLMRYFQITTTRVRPGHDAQYAEYVQKILNVARQKAKVDNLHAAVFQIISGTQGGTYMTFRPLRSLGELDEGIAAKVRAAMSDDMKKDADKLASEAIMSTDVSTYAFAPNMSYVEKEFAAADPAFWNPKPAMMPRPKPKKHATAPTP